MIQMTAVEIGKICIKDYGREKGKRCVIIDIVDKNYVIITGPKNITGVRRRKSNIRHLTLTEEKIPIKKGATDKEVEAALKKPTNKEKSKSKK